MFRKIEGKLSGENLSFGIIVSRFNNFVSERLLAGAIDCLVRHNVSENSIDVVWVPGAFEIPSVAKILIGTNKYDAIICLGAVVRGETPHFDYVASEVSKGIASLSLEGKIPVIFGVLTTDNLEQAIERSGGKAGNKGFDAAMAAIEMANLFSVIK